MHSFSHDLGKWSHQNERFPGPATQPPARLPQPQGYPVRAPMPMNMNPHTGHQVIERPSGPPIVEGEDLIDSTLNANLARLNMKNTFKRVHSGHYHFSISGHKNINIYINNRNGALFLCIEGQGPELTLFQFFERHALLPPTPPMPMMSPQQQGQPVFSTESPPPFCEDPPL
eukprot:gene236-1098_t